MRTVFGSLRASFLARQGDAGFYKLGLNSEKEVVLLRWDSVANRGSPLITHLLSQPLKPGQEFDLELRLMGQTLTAKFNGEVIGTATDGTFKQGRFSVTASSNVENLSTTALVKTLEALDLDNATPVTALSPSPNSPVSASSPAKFPPGQWVKPYTKFEDVPPKARSDMKLTWKDGWIDGTNSTDKFALFTIVGTRWKNQGIRARLKHVPGTESAYPATVSLRSVPGKRYSLNYSFDDQKARIALAAQQTTEALATLSPKNRPPAGAEYDLEFYAIGEKLFGRINGELLLVSSDNRLGEGDITLQIKHLIRDIEVINLDGLSEAEALKILGVDENGNDLRQKPAAVASATPTASSPTPAAAKSAMAPASSSPSLPISQSSDPKFPPGQWVKMFTKFEDLPENLRTEVTWEDGWINSKTKPVAWRFPIKMRNGAIRVTSTKNSAFELRVRASLPGDQTYTLMSSKRMTRASSETGKLVHTDLAKGSIPTGDGLWELAVIGNRIIGRIHGQIMGFVADDSISSGYPAIVNGIGSFRDIEVINLDGLPEAEALRILGVDEKGNDLRALAAKQEQQMAEQAKAADAMAAIPELKVLHEQFVKLQGERVTAPFEAEVAKLNAGYVGGIDREIANEKKAGHLDGVIALEAEKKLIADQQPVPAEDDEKATEALKKLRGIYRAAYAKLEATRAENLKALTDPLSIRLKQLESTLTQQNRIEHAKTVREYRENLGKEGSADTPVRTSPTGGAAATMNEAGKSARAPLKKFPPGDDRKAAEWVLDMGGTIGIRDANGEQNIQAKGSLPKRPFDLIGVNLAAPERASRQVIEYTGLLSLAGLRKLNNIAISSLPVADDETEILASLPELARLQLSNVPAFTGKKLALLKEATKVNWMNLGGNGITPEGLEQITQFTNLTGLQLNKTYIGDNDVAPLARLKKLAFLSLNDTKVTLEGWKQLKGLPLTELESYFPRGSGGEWCTAMAALFPDVNKLTFSATEAVATEDVAAVAAFPELRTLILATTYMDDALVGTLAKLTKLETLTLRAGSVGPVKTVTDASMDSILALKKLVKLRLEKIDTLTPAALTTLTKIKSLKTLEVVKCPQLDDTAIAAFQKERPDVTVTR
jgi:hypothetical protein